MKRLVQFLPMALVALAAVPANAGVIINGGFETKDFSRHGWTVVARSTFVTDSFDGFKPHSGTYFAYLGNAGDVGSLSQTVSDTAGQSYLLSLYLGSDGGTPNQFVVEFNGNILYDQVNLPDTRSNADQYNLLSFDVLGTGSDTLTLLERDDPGYLALDDVSLTPNNVVTPEPSSLLLFGMATVGFVVYCIRRG